MERLVDYRSHKTQLQEVASNPTAGEDNKGNTSLHNIQPNDSSPILGLCKQLAYNTFQTVAITARKTICTPPISSLLLRYYVHTKNTEGTRFLLDHGAPVDQDWLTYKAAANRDSITLHLLLEHGASAKRLLESYIPGKPEALKWLIKKYGVNLDNPVYLSLMTTAAKRGCTESLNFFLDNITPPYHLLEPYLAALSKGNIDCCRLLNEYGALQWAERGLRFLHFEAAFRENSVKSVEFLLSQNPFSTKAVVLDEGFIGNKVTLTKVCKDYFKKALEMKCCGHILWLMLVESGTDGLDELRDFECEDLYQEALELKLLNPPEESEAEITDFRNQLRGAVNEAHCQLQSNRFTLQAIVTPVVKQIFINKLGRNPDNAKAIRASIDQLDFPEHFKKILKEQHFSAALHSSNPVQL